MGLDTLTIDMMYLAITALGVVIRFCCATLVLFAVFDALISFSKVYRR